MIKKVTVAILILLLVPAVLFSAPTKKWKKHAKLIGKLGYGVLQTDAYYEICHSKGIRTDNYLRGLDKLLKNKWGITFSKMSKKYEERSGRDFREEAHNMIYRAIKKFNGCNTSGMKKWFDTVSKLHSKNLDKFHAIK